MVVINQKKYSDIYENIYNLAGEMLNLVYKYEKEREKKWDRI